MNESNFKNCDSNSENSIGKNSVKKWNFSVKNLICPSLLVCYYNLSLNFVDLFLCRYVDIYHREDAPERTNIICRTITLT